MSFLYRPTPVVNLAGWDAAGEAFIPYGLPVSPSRENYIPYGFRRDVVWPGAYKNKQDGPFSSKNTLNRFPGTVMNGIPAGSSALGKAAPTGAVSAMRRVDTRMQPWIKSSGTMGSFLPNGLGQDDGSGGTGIDWSTWGAPVVPEAPPDFIPPDLTPPDFGSPSFLPNLPALIPVSVAPAPVPWQVPLENAPISGTLTPPPAGAGPTGIGIPGTQPLQVITQGLSWFEKIFGALPKPAAAPAPNYKQLPGYGGGVVAPSSALSWFSEKTLPFSQQLGSNGMVLGLGIVIALVVFGGGAAAARSRR